jgi:Zn-dependent M28 family amino/carboxypeptidase
VEDAAGAAGLVTLAQSFVRTQPTADRSIVFIAFTAAESGFLGSAYYAANPVFPLRDTAAVLNLDTMHIGGPTRDLIIFGSGNSELEDYVREAAQQQGREVRADPEPERGTYFRSDQITFARSGVPSLIFQAGLDDSARGPAWGQAQRADYRMKRYYEPSDQYSADWDVRGTLDDLRLYYEVGNRLTHSRRFPRWYPNSEFRATKPSFPEPPSD